MTKKIAAVLDSQPLDQGDVTWDALGEIVDLTLYTHTSPSQVISRIQNAQIILTNKVRLTAEHMAQAPRLEFISVLATGYDCVDISAARQRNILVANVPHYSTASTAQITIALMLEITQAVGLHNHAVHEGQWVKSSYYSFWKQPLIELEGKTLVIIGMGAIGTRVAKIALALGMSLCVAELPDRPRRTLDGVESLPFDQALSKADFLSLHCPLTPQTRHLINARTLGLLKPGCFLINTARGGLIDEDALAKALHSDQIAGAALDVLSTEPPIPVNPLLNAPRCIITPHIAWATIEARCKLLQITIDNIRQYLNGTPVHIIN